MNRSFIKTASSLTTITLAGCTLIAPSGLSGKVETPTQNATLTPSAVPNTQDQNSGTLVPESSASATTTAQTPLPTSGASASTDTATASPTPSVGTDGTAPIPSPTPTVAPTPSPTPSPSPTPIPLFNMATSSNMPDMIATFAESPMLGADILVSTREDIDVIFKEARDVNYTDLYPDYQYHGDRNRGYSYSINDGATASLEFGVYVSGSGLGRKVTQRLVDTASQKIRLGKGTANTLRIFQTPVNYIADVYSSGHYQETYERFKVFRYHQGTVMPANAMTLEGVGVESGASISVTLEASMSSPHVVPFVVSAIPLTNTTVKSDPSRRRSPVKVGALKLKGSDYYGDPDGPIEGYIYGLSGNISGTCYHGWSCYYSDCGGSPIDFQKNKYLGAYYFGGTYIKNGEQKFYCHFNENDVGKTFTFTLTGYVMEPHIRGPLPNPYSALYEHAVILLPKPVHLSTVTVIAD